MSLRPRPARWFELLVARDDLTVAVDILAASSRVELQSHGQSAASLLMPECRRLLDEIDELVQRFEGYLPPARAHEPNERSEPHAMLRDALDRLHGWASAAGEVVATLESLTGQQRDLVLFRTMIGGATGLPDLRRFTNAGPLLETCGYVLDEGRWPRALPGSVITQRVRTPAGDSFLLGLGLPGELARLEAELEQQKAQRIQIPKDLPPSAADAESDIERRLVDVEDRLRQSRDALDALSERYDIADALADAEFVRWYVDNVPELSATENFAWITGWTSDETGESLLSELAGHGVKGLLRLADAPPGFDIPLILKNPAWMRPFELFTRMLGTPGAGDVDPTRIVAIVGPVMFGFMFGDVVHGALLLLAGLALRRRFPATRLLIAGGAMSILFGFLFGSVFALETIIEPLWLHPLSAPILMLIVPMIGGAVLLTTGMLLDALQAVWRSGAGKWLATGAGLMLCYLALLGSVMEPRLLWLALAGGIWFVLGHAINAPARRAAGALGAATELIESLLQLVVNTVSFVRVGAFALAHAGLSLAVVGLAEATPTAIGWFIVLTLGNLLIVGLEGLVVSIQTTRLVLFEFFVRFLRAEGRPFKPLEPSSSYSPSTPRRRE